MGILAQSFFSVRRVINGNDSYNVIIDHETHAVACDSSGNVLPDELGSTGKAQFILKSFKGSALLTMRYSTEVSSMGQCCWSIGSVDGVTYTAYDDTIVINTLTKNSGKISIHCFLEGSVYIDKVVVLTKQKQGMQGSVGKTWKPLISDEGILKWINSIETPNDIDLKNTIVTKEAIYKILQTDVKSEVQLEEYSDKLVLRNKLCLTDVSCDINSPIFNIPLASGTKIGLMSAADKSKLDKCARTDQSNDFDSRSTADIYSANGIIINKWGKTHPCYTMYTNLPGTSRGWMGMGTGENEDTILFGHCNWNDYFDSSIDITLKVAGNIDAKNATFSSGNLMLGNISSVTPSISHYASVNLKIGNPSNSAYVQFVEDVKFDKNTTFSGTGTFLGNIIVNNSQANGQVYSTGGVWGKLEFIKSAVYDTGFYSGLGIYTDQDICLFAGSQSGNKTNCTVYIGQGRLHSRRAITAEGSITPNYGSDRRLKENITSLTKASEILKEFRIYEFDYTDDALKRDVGLQKHSFGMMYDEIKSSKLSQIGSTSEDGYGAINYNSPSLVCIMIAAEIELINKFEAIGTEQQKQEKRIKTLEEELNYLKTNHLQ